MAHGQNSGNTVNRENGSVDSITSKVKTAEWRIFPFLLHEELVSMKIFGYPHKFFCCP